MMWITKENEDGWHAHATNASPTYFNNQMNDVAIWQQRFNVAFNVTLCSNQGLQIERNNSIFKRLDVVIYIVPNFLWAGTGTADAQLGIRDWSAYMLC